MREEDRGATVQPQDTKHYYHFVMLSMLFSIISMPTAGKTVDIFGIPLSVTIFYFPIVYIVADVVTEVYGYVLARRALWYSVMAQLIAAAIFQLVAWAPPSETLENGEAFARVLSQAPVIFIVGTIAIFAGDIVNNYVLAKMKVRSKGDKMAFRFIASTAAGEFVNTAIFYFCALVALGVVPFNVAFYSVLIASVIKIFVEIIMLPVTVKVAHKIKMIEGIDAFDTHTNFNPLKF